MWSSNRIEKVKSVFVWGKNPIYFLFKNGSNLHVACQRSDRIRNCGNFIKRDTLYQIILCPWWCFSWDINLQKTDTIYRQLPEMSFQLCYPDLFSQELKSAQISWVAERVISVWEWLIRLAYVNHCFISSWTDSFHTVNFHQPLLFIHLPNKHEKT